MKCNVCPVTLKFVCECGLAFCEAHELSHSIEFRHFLQRVEENEEVREKCSNEDGDMKAPSLESARELVETVHANKKFTFKSVEEAKKTLATDGLFLEGHFDSVWSVAVTSDNNFIISGSEDKALRIWDLKTKQQQAILKGHFSGVTSVALTIDNNLIGSGSKDKTVRIWNLKTRRQEAVLKGHTESVNTVAFTSKNNFIVSGSDDETVSIWSIKTRRQLAVLKGHWNSVISVVVTSNINFIVSGSSDNTVRIWNLKKSQKQYWKDILIQSQV